MPADAESELTVCHFLTPQLRLSQWFVDAKCNVVINHNSREHMRSDLMRYFYWSLYTEFYGRSPSLSEVPHCLRPNHKNVTGDATNSPFGDRFRVQAQGKPSTTVVSHIALKKGLAVFC